MTLTVIPTDEEVEAVREMMGENSFSHVSSLLSAGNDAQWAATLLDIAEWTEKVRGKYVRLSGEASLDPRDRAYAIRTRVRTRYGLTEKVDSSVTGEPQGSYVVPIEVRY